MDLAGRVARQRIHEPDQAGTFEPREIGGAMRVDVMIASSAIRCSGTPKKELMPCAGSLIN